MAQRRCGPTDEGRAGVQLGGEPGLSKTSSLQLQREGVAPALTRRARTMGALRDFDTYRALRLAQLNDPAVITDCGWKRRVDSAFSRFCRSFERIAS